MNLEMEAGLLKGNGRPKGSQNKVSGKLREVIAQFLDENFDKLKADFEDMDPKERASFYEKLLPYALPRLQSVTTTTKYEELSDAQLDELVNRLRGVETGHY